MRARRGTDVGFPEERANATERTRREMIMLAYLAEHDLGEKPVRFDNIAMVVAAEDRAFSAIASGTSPLKPTCSSSTPSRRPLRPPDLFEGQPSGPSGRRAFSSQDSSSLGSSRTLAQIPSGTTSANLPRDSVQSP